LKRSFSRKQTPEIEFLLFAEKAGLSRSTTTFGMYENLFRIEGQYSIQSQLLTIISYMSLDHPSPLSQLHSTLLHRPGDVLWTYIPLIDNSQLSPVYRENQPARYSMKRAIHILAVLGLAVCEQGLVPVQAGEWSTAHKHL
jgi:hypothetical protein